MNTEEIFQQVMDENCKDPLHRFADLVRQDEREQAEYDNLTVRFGEKAKVYLVEAKKSWDTSDMAHRPNGLTVDDDIQEYKRPWIGMSDVEVETYSNVYCGISLARMIEALLKERNT